MRSIKAEHIAGADNVQVDWLSGATIDHSEWCLHPALFEEMVSGFGRLIIDLFMSQMNSQLPRVFSWFSTWGRGSQRLLLPLAQGPAIRIPPIALLPHVISRIQQTRAEVILIAPYWPRHPWFMNLVTVSIAPPWRIPPDRVSLSQGPICHPEPQCLHLTTWRLSGDCWRSGISLQT